MVLKGCFYVGVSPCRLCLSSVFGVRAGSDVDASHVFPQCLLATITLVGSVVGIGGSKAYAACEVELSLCSIAIAGLLGWGRLPSCLSRSPEGWAQADPVPFECVFCPKERDYY